MDLNSNVEIVIRPIEARDAPEVSLLVQQLGYERSLESVLAWIETIKSAALPQSAFVACIGVEIIGWIEISLEHRLQTPTFALIGGLVVKDGARGRGIGRLLCERAELWSWQQGVSVVRVTSRSNRSDAHRFYLRDGYCEVKTSIVFEKRRPV